MNTQDIKFDFSDLRKTIERIEKRMNAEIDIKKRFKKDFDLLSAKVKKYNKNYDINFILIYK